MKKNILNPIGARFQRAFTFLEAIIAVAVVAVIVSLAVPAIRDALIRAEIASATRKSDEINKALTRARVEGYEPPGAGSDVEEARNWLVEHGFLQRD